MKTEDRVLIFAWKIAEGGWSDYVCSVDTIEQAKRFMSDNKDKYVSCQFIKRGIMLLTGHSRVSVVRELVYGSEYIEEEE